MIKQNKKTFKLKEKKFIFFDKNEKKVFYNEKVVYALGTAKYKIDSRCPIILVQMVDCKSKQKNNI